MKSKRQRHSSAFKTNVAIEAIQEQESLSELSMKYGIHPNMISCWQKGLPACAPKSKEKTSREDFRGLGLLHSDQKFNRAEYCN